MTQTAEIQLDNAPATESRLAPLRQALLGSGSTLIVDGILLLNLFFQLGRPQAFLPVLASAKITVLLFLTALAIALPRLGSRWPWQLKAMFGFLAFHAVFIMIGRFVFDDLINNDGQALARWRQLLQDWSCFLLPLMLCLRSAKSVVRLQFTLNLICLWLALYVSTHGGHGPEGFLGDENDVCMALVMLLPYALLNATSLKGGKRLPYMALSLFTLVAIVITKSRGGFLGLVAMFGVLLLRSPKKVPMLLSAGLVVLLALPFVSQEYMGEIETISASEGTGKERMDTWGYVWKMFLDPRNTIQGVGISNTPYSIGDYEPASAGISQKTLHGRAVHSTFFELLGDQGIIGLLLIGSIFGRSILSAVRNSRRLHDLSRTRLSKDPAIAKVAGDYIHRLHILSVAIQCSWAGAIVSALFISTLYYPPLWILVTISAIHASVTDKLFQATHLEERRPEVEVIPA